MTPLEYGKVETALHDDPNWRALAESPVARLAYLGFRSSSRLTYAGCYYCPLDVFAFQNMIQRGDLEVAIAQLIEKELIEFDRDNEWVRIVGWYHGLYAQENASKVTSWSRNYLEGQMPNCQLTTNSAAEFTIGSLKRAGNFHAKSDHAEVVYACLVDFTRNASRLFDGLPEALQCELKENGFSSWRHLRGRGEELVSISKIEAAGAFPRSANQSEVGVEAPSIHSAGRVAPHIDIDKNIDKNAADIADNVARPLLSTVQSKIAQEAIAG